MRREKTLLNVIPVFRVFWAASAIIASAAFGEIFALGSRAGRSYLQLAIGVNIHITFSKFRMQVFYKSLDRPPSGHAMKFTSRLFAVE